MESLPTGLAASLAEPPAPHVVRRVEMLINPLAGNADADAPLYAERMLADLGLSSRIRTPAPEELWRELKAAVESAPDVLIVLAGDGTARAAASLCGPDGPALAPLPGGTMNLLPRALYGLRDWKAVLADTLVGGVLAPISGGVVDDRRFYVAAILGAPALWAEAREAARHRQLGLAVMKARNAWRRAFTRRLDYQLDGRPPQRSLALTLMCPLVSRAMDLNERALEAAALDPQGVADALRLGARTVLSRLTGDWRSDPAVDVTRCRTGRTWTGGRYLHAILDGEPFRLHKQVDIRFEPTAFRALIPAAEPPPHAWSE